MVNAKVLIVGAGAAGLACATKLLENGFPNVFIVEAETYIGGRIATIPFADNVIDLGAMWCHGEKDNVVFELAKGKNLLETSGNMYITTQYIRSNGDVVPDNVVQKLKDILSEIFEARRRDLLNFSGSLDQYLTQMFYSKLKKFTSAELDHIVADEFFINFKKIESSETKSGVDEVSTTGFLEYWRCDGDFLLNWKDKGFAEFIKLLIKSKTNGPAHGILNGKIVTGMTVEKINMSRTDGIIEVKCEGFEEAFLAEHVVVTVSLGVLKERMDTLFYPTLPSEKSQSIDGLSFGDMAKVFLEFPFAFWPENWTGFNTLWRKQDIKEISNTQLAWTVHIYGFYCVNYQPRLLIAWLVGPSAVRFEKMPETDVITGCMTVLKRFLSWSIPNPLHVYRTTWQTNRNFRGAYSFRSIKTDSMITGAGQLAQPLVMMAPAPLREGEDESTQRLTVKPIVQFAGEASSEHYYSTVHGAVESGWREADRLIAYYENES